MKKTKKIKIPKRVGKAVLEKVKPADCFNIPAWQFYANYTGTIRAGHQAAVDGQDIEQNPFDRLLTKEDGLFFDAWETGYRNGDVMELSPIDESDGPSPAKPNNQKAMEGQP